MSDRAYDSLYGAILDLAGPDVTIAEVNRITEELHGQGVKAWMIRKIVKAGLSVSLGASGLSEPRAWYIGIQRWPVACRLCGSEIRRGSHMSIGKLPAGEWAIECAGCRAVDPSSERAKAARTWALSKDDDPDSLLVAILDHAPVELREEIEDDLSLALEAGRG
jgi:hypothetical protein